MKYTWTQYDDVITKAQCKALIETGEKLGFDDARVGNQLNPSYYDPNTRNCRKASIPFKQLLWLEDLLINAMADINNANYRFDLEGFSDLEVIEYKQGTYFKPHLDTYLGIPEYQRKLTFIFQLSDPDDYVGGDLAVYTHLNEELMTRKQGSLIIFPSYTMHEVKEVLSGTRYSLIGWVLGPEFR